MFTKKVLISVSIIFLTIVAIVLMVLQKEDIAQIENKKEAQYVTTAKALKGSWKPMHSVIGKIDSNSIVEIKSRLNAKVESILVKSGEQVTKGQLLVELDQTDANREMERLNARLLDLNAQIEIQKRQHELDRTLLVFDKEQLAKSEENYAKESTLLAKQLISNSQFEQAKSELNQSTRAVLQRQLSVENQKAQQAQMKSTLIQLEINIEAQQEQLAFHHVTAQFDGVVAGLNIKVGQALSVGESIVTVLNDQSRLFNVKVSSMLAEQLNAELNIGETMYSIESVDSILGVQQAGQSVVFDISGQSFPIGSYQYAYWVSPAIESSFLIDPKALFEFERVYYLKQKLEDMDATKEAPETIFELMEASVKLHGIHIKDDKEFWVATSQQLPEEVMLLTSKLNNLYSGIEVTNKIPEVKEESKQTDDGEVDNQKDMEK